MTELFDYPPNIEAIRAVLDIPKYGVVFTYGDTLYNPDHGHIDAPLWTHEETHARQQQRMGVEAWWTQYLFDPEFRTKQELEAYIAQYKHYCQVEHDRNKQVVFLSRIAKDLSSPMYGSVISFTEALNQIRNGIIQKSGAMQFSSKRTELAQHPER